MRTGLRRLLLLSSVALPGAWVSAASASYVYLHGMGYPGYFEFPWTQFWTALPYVISDGWRGPASLKVWGWCAISAATAGLVITAIGIGAWKLWRRSRRRLVPLPGGGLRPLEPGVTDNLGHASFATLGQIAGRFGGPGCLIGAMDRSPGARLIRDDPTKGPGHAMSFAGPGSDKTTSAVTRIWTWRGPRVVFDPSLELGPIMADALREAGCNVFTLGMDGGGINALDWIDVAHPEADAHIRSAVDWIYNENATSRSGADRAGDPFWGTWGRALTACLMAHILYHPDRTEPKTLANLRRFIAVGESRMKTLLRGIHASSASRMARDLAGGLMDMEAGETFSGIYSNCFAATEWLSVGAYADVVSGSAIRTADILKPETVVFVQLPLRTLLATPAVGRAVMGALFNAMFHADGSGISERILFEIDEARTLGRLKEIQLCHETARKYRGLVHTIWQSEGQLEEVYGRDGAKTMRDTVSWRSYNAISDGDIAERLSRDLGEHAVLAYSEGDNSGSQKPWGIALPSQSSGRNLNVHEIKRRLIKADEIMRAPADEMFVLARDFPHPIRCNTAPYWRYSEVARLMQANRFVSRAAE
jgi:type IV secretion system protein VirD4